MIVNGGQPQQPDPNNPLKLLPHGAGDQQTAQPAQPAQNQSMDYWIHSKDNPYLGKGGIQNDLSQQAWAAYQNIYGRAPTNDELAQATQAFASADPNKSNIQQGMAFVAQAHQATENTPDKLYAQQQAQYKQQAPQQYGAVNQMFQSQLGRAASQDELDHFGSLLASGTTDPYQLQQFLQQQPEYQTKQNDQMRQGLSKQMASNDQRQFSEQILPGIQQAYAKQGRSFDSSGFQNAATQSAQAQNTQREGFLNNLSAQQYGGVQDRAYQDYANQVANQQNLTNSGIQAQYAGVQGVQNRGNQIGDYNTQASAYNDYLAKYGKRNNGLGGLIGSVAGAGIGGYFGGTAGAQLGSSLGNAGGTAIQNSRGGSY